MHKDGHGGENVSSTAESCIQGQSPIQQFARALEGVGEGGQEECCILDKFPVKIKHSQESLKSRVV